MNEFLIWIAILASLLAAVIWNNQSHMKRHKTRRKRNYGKSYHNKKNDKIAEK